MSQSMEHLLRIPLLSALPTEDGTILAVVRVELKSGEVREIGVELHRRDCDGALHVQHLIIPQVWILNPADLDWLNVRGFTHIDLATWIEEREWGKLPIVAK